MPQDLIYYIRAERQEEKKEGCTMKALCVAGVVGLWLCVMVSLVASGTVVNVLAAASGGSAAIGYKFSEWGR